MYIDNCHVLQGRFKYEASSLLTVTIESSVSIRSALFNSPKLDGAAVGR